MPRLSPEDQARVDRYLSSNINQVERKPFRPWVLLGIVFIVLGLLTLVAYLFAKFHGVV